MEAQANANGARNTSPVRILVTIIMGIFLSEIVAMVAIYFLPPLPYPVQTLLDALIMTALIFPIVYHYSFRHLVTHMEGREQALQALDVERQRLFKLLDQLPAFVYLRTEDYAIRFANSRFRELFGEPDGTPCYVLKENSDTPCSHCLSQLVFSQNIPAKWEWTSLDGRWYQIYDYPFTDIDGESMILKLGIDITDRKQAEDELERNYQELQALTIKENQQRLLAEALADSTLALNSSLDLDEVLTRILQQILKVIPCEGAAIMLSEEKRISLVRYLGSQDPPASTLELASGLEIDNAPVLKTIAASDGPLIFSDLQKEQIWPSLPGMEWLHSSLAVALRSMDAVLGYIFLVSSEQSYFDEQDAERLTAFAGHAVAAVQNAWLFEQVRSGRERLQYLSHRLVEVQENERRYLAHELHDEVGQSLVSMLLAVQLLEQDVSNPKTVLDQLDEIESSLNEVSENLHRLAVNLRPPSLDHIGLIPALQQHAALIQERHGLVVGFESVGINARLPSSIEIALYRIVQEALTNIVRHAQAKKVSVILQERKDVLVLVVEDDGVGFNIYTDQPAHRLGIAGIRERADMLGGNLEIESSPGKGTTIIVEVPYDSENSVGR